MRITVPGTFIFCKGALIIDGWGVELNEGEELTQLGINDAILRFLHDNMVVVPNEQASAAAQSAIDKMKRGENGAGSA